jgi:hypothetical protein
MARMTVETDQKRRTALQHILIMPFVWQEVMSPTRAVWKSEVNDVNRNSLFPIIQVALLLLCLEFKN